MYAYALIIASSRR